MAGLRKSGPEYIITKEDVDLQEDFTDYFEEVSEEDANKVVEFFISEKKRKGVDPFYVDIYRMLQKGIKVRKVIFILHRTSSIRILLKGMFSIPLFFLSGFKAVRDLMDKLSEEAVSKHIGGYFTPEDNVIRMAIDPKFMKDVINGNTDEYRKNDFIPAKSFLEYVILHEACHYYEYNKVKEYLTTFYEPMLLPFYTEYLKTMYRTHRGIDNRDVPERVFVKAAKVMITILSAKQKINPTNEDYLKMFKVTKDALNKVLPDLGNIWYYSNPFDDLSQTAMNRGYAQIGVDAQIAMFFNKYQEVFCTSEVVAVAAFQAYMYGGKLKGLYTKMMKEVF